MFSGASKKILNIFRKLIGVDLILQYQRNLVRESENIIIKKLQKQIFELHRQGLMLEKTLSLLENSVINDEQVKKTFIYKKCSALISLLSPMDIKGYEFVRIGNKYDGGYVMVDNFGKEKIEAAYSFGIGSDVSWDEEVASRGIDVFMYDHTIDKLPKKNQKFHFSKTGIGKKKIGNLFKTVNQVVDENGHINANNLLMKMDIEGSEWDAFEEVSSDVLASFSQMIVEFHGLSPKIELDEFNKKIKVLEKINLTHQSVHIHANSCSSPVWIGGMVLPDMLEVTFIRRRDYEGVFRPNTRSFPTKYDSPTFEGGRDIPLGMFSPSP